MKFAAGFFLTIAATALAAAPSTLAELQSAFEHPPDDARIMVRWWWFGPAAQKTELEREMRLMKAGGMGGFEVQATYPLALDGNVPYLSPEFLDSLKFAGEKARELGLRMDVTLASGWPFGGPHIPITQAAGRLRVERVHPADSAESIPLPELGEGEKFIAAFPGAGPRLTDIQNGSLNLPPGKQREVLFFIASRTRQMVKRAAVRAEGFVLDHYDRSAIENHLNLVGERLMGALLKNPPYAIFSDSLEVYGTDWTGDFLDEFRRRRGYDLTPQLPSLADNASEKTGAIRHDWGKTLSELAEERYLTPIREWARRHGTRFRSQTYGIPPVTLSSNALVDLPEGEGWQWRRFSSTRWASSASHLYGKPVTSSETWTWLHSPVFRATPLDMKAEADLHFLEGVNQLVGHGWPYSPPEAGEPGWRFYAAAVFNPHNPWWNVMPDITAYLQRVSFLLRQGQPVNDIAVYLPTSDAYAGFTLGHDSVNQAMDGLIGPDLIPQILDAGYSFDFIDDGAIAAAGIPYRVLILPGVTRIPLATLHKIDEYSRKGGIAVATRQRPSLAPGLMEAESETPKIRAMAGILKLLPDEKTLGAELKSLIPPDVEAAPELGFVHRNLSFADVYFLANTTNRPMHSQAAFRIQDRDAAWWDPFTGMVSAASGGSRLQLDLEPYESRVLVFSKDHAPKAPSRGGAQSHPLDISSGWTVTFGDAGQSVMMDLPKSWTEHDQYFSGLATYEKTVQLPRSMARREIYLDFGVGTPVTMDEPRAGPGMRAMLESPVREAAVIYVNGKRAGAVWKPPYEVRISGLAHPGDNRIRIVVANLAINQMARNPLPDYKELNARYGERFQAQDMAGVVPQASGLLGRVRVLVR